MQTIAGQENVDSYLSALDLVDSNKIPPKRIATTSIVYGLHQSIIKKGIWLNILLLSFYHYKNPVTAFKAIKNLKKLRSNYHGKHSIIKYAKTNDTYYFSFNAPGWPSLAFNKYVLNNIKKSDVSVNTITLDTILFGITKKCEYLGEHCFEWDALNKPDTLSRQELLTIINSFLKVGITQVQLSGGEPLNRFDDIIYLLQNIKKPTEVWLYTSGYHLTDERAAALKHNGLTGVTVSLDHWLPGLHNSLRGKNNAYAWAEKAIANARNNGLVVCLSLYATKDFVTRENLVQYAELAKIWHISFIQVLEPKAIGHYRGKDFSLTEEQLALLEDFYLAFNYDKEYREYPAIVYHGYSSRHMSCGGSGNDYVYIDTDGDIHNCPVCQAKLFSALHDDLEANLRAISAKGCNVFGNLSS